MSETVKTNEPVEILCLEGDGIGPEITAATRRILDAVDRRFALGLTFTSHEIGFNALKTVGTTFPDHGVAI